MIKKLIKSIDYGILIIVFLLFIIGLIGLKSATGGAGGDPNEFSKQITWFVFGIFIIFFFINFDYKHLSKIAVPLYILFLVLLIGVLFTNPVNGATSWYNLKIMSFQPSEFEKIVIIITYAKFLSYLNSKKTLNKFYNILLSLLILAIPIFFIIRQPDYGTAIIIIVIACTMLFVAGIKWRYIIISVLLVAVSLPFLYQFVLPEHAKARINVFLNPESDPRGAGYNIIQSKIAVGSGSIHGMGLFNGNQTQLGFLPMKTTDFIFSVISEELGFIVSTLIVLLFVVLLVRIINLSRKSKDEFGKLICAGIFALFFSHFVENIGMGIGLLPITGVPLPFISYGGSSMLTNMICIGILTSISCRRKRDMFWDLK